MSKRALRSDTRGFITLIFFINNCNSSSKLFRFVCCWFLFFGMISFRSKIIGYIIFLLGERIHFLISDIVLFSVNPTGGFGCEQNC